MCTRERKRGRGGVVEIENSHSQSLFPREGTVYSEYLVCIWQTHGPNSIYRVYSIDRLTGLLNGMWMCYCISLWFIF